MKKLFAICFGLALSVGVAFAQSGDMQNDSMKNDNTTKKEMSGKTAKVTGKISEDGKSFVSDTDSKSYTISNPEAVKGHEGHHVILTAHVNADKDEVHVMSLKMAK